MSQMDHAWAVTIAIFAVLIGCLYAFSVSTYDYWKKRGVPYPKPTPLFGNIAQTILLRRNFFQVHQDLYRRFSDHRFVGIYHARQPALLLRDPDLIKAVLVEDFAHFHDRNIVIHPEKNPLQVNLFTLRGREWTALRRKITPTFTSARLKGMFPLMDECRASLVSYLKDAADKSEVVEVKDALTKFSTDIIGTCAFGIDMNALDNPDSEFRRMGRKVFELSAGRRLALLLNILLPEIAQWIKLDDLGMGVSKFFIRVVKEVIDYRKENGTHRKDFMQQLIELKTQESANEEGEEEDENGKEKSCDEHEDKDPSELELDDTLIAAHAFLFFLAGSETAASTSSFTLHELAVNPDLQNKLRQEVEETLAQNEGQFTYEALMKMQFLDKVVSETLRKYPPVQLLRRAVTIPYTVPGTQVRLDERAHVVVPTFSIHRDPKFYPDPERFDPERFSDARKANIHKFAYLPFGEGPRSCLAKVFGQLQVKLILAGMVAAYEFHTCDQTQDPPQFSSRSFNLSTVNGTHLRITHRNKHQPTGHSH